MKSASGSLQGRLGVLATRPGHDLLNVKVALESPQVAAVDRAAGVQLQRLRTTGPDDLQQGVVVFAAITASGSRLDNTSVMRASHVLCDEPGPSSAAISG